VGDCIGSDMLGCKSWAAPAQTKYDPRDHKETSKHLCHSTILSQSSARSLYYAILVCRLIFRTLLLALSTKHFIFSFIIVQESFGQI
jgi:hypothetical protein